MIVDLYFTIRGFSFTKSFMERYKQECKKSTQKSKALRKNLNSYLDNIVERLDYCKYLHGHSIMHSISCYRFFFVASFDQGRRCT